MKELAVCCPIRNTWYARICRDTTAARFLVKDKGKVVVLDLDPITPVLRFFKLFTSTEIFKLTSTYPFLVKYLCCVTIISAQFVQRSSPLLPHSSQRSLVSSVRIWGTDKSFRRYTTSQFLVNYPFLRYCCQASPCQIYPLPGPRGSLNILVDLSGVRRQAIPFSFHACYTLQCFFTPQV